MAPPPLDGLEGAIVHDVLLGAAHDALVLCTAARAIPLPDASAAWSDRRQLLPGVCVACTSARAGRQLAARLDLRPLHPTLLLSCRRRGVPSALLKCIYDFAAHPAPLYLQIPDRSCAVPTSAAPHASTPLSTALASAAAPAARLYPAGVLPHAPPGAPPRSSLTLTATRVSLRWGARRPTMHCPGAAAPPPARPLDIPHAAPQPDAEPPGATPASAATTLVTALASLSPESSWLSLPPATHEPPPRATGEGCGVDDDAGEGVCNSVHDVLRTRVADVRQRTAASLSTTSSSGSEGVFGVCGGVSVVPAPGEFHLRECEDVACEGDAAELLDGGALRALCGRVVWRVELLGACEALGTLCGVRLVVADPSRGWTRQSITFAADGLCARLAAWARPMTPAATALPAARYYQPRTAAALPPLNCVFKILRVNAGPPGTSCFILLHPIDPTPAFHTFALYCVTHGALPIDLLRVVFQFAKGVDGAGGRYPPFADAPRSDTEPFAPQPRRRGVLGGPPVLPLWAGGPPPPPQPQPAWRALPCVCIGLEMNARAPLYSTAQEDADGGSDYERLRTQHPVAHTQQFAHARSDTPLYIGHTVRSVRYRAPLWRHGAFCDPFTVTSLRLAVGRGAKHSHYLTITAATPIMVVTKKWFGLPYSLRPYGTRVPLRDLRAFFPAKVVRMNLGPPHQSLFILLSGGNYPSNGVYAAFGMEINSDSRLIMRVS